MSRTAEQGHTYKCLAKTMIAAIENQRDYLSDAQTYRFNPITSSAADFDFRIWAQNNGPMVDADGYLADGISDCVCPELPALVEEEFACEYCGCTVNPCDCDPTKVL